MLYLRMNQQCASFLLVSSFTQTLPTASLVLRSSDDHDVDRNHGISATSESQDHRNASTVRGASDEALNSDGTYATSKPQDKRIASTVFGGTSDEAPNSDKVGTKTNSDTDASASDTDASASNDGATYSKDRGRRRSLPSASDLFFVGWCIAFGIGIPVALVFAGIEGTKAKKEAGIW